jgi:dihydroorotate dehydrogenase electron transfer subunit
VSPTQFRARVVENRSLTGGYFILNLQTDDENVSGAPLFGLTPGQFVMLRGEWGQELLNPRAFSVLRADERGGFSVMLKVYGRGTARMKAMGPGDPMMVTGPLGRGFVAPGQGTRQLLVAGGVGLPPLHLQASVAAAAGHADQVEVFYGGRNRDDLVLIEDFERWNVAATYATEDGSHGAEGFVTVPLAERVAEAKANGESIEILSCGPTPMLQAVRTLGLQQGVQTWLCLEEEMACGFGVCLGCAVPVYGEKPYRYCCTDGPVFDAREVRWS